MKRLDPSLVQQQIANLILQYPELQEDEALRADMIEGETEAFEFLSQIVRVIGATKALADGTDRYAQELRERSARFDRRVEAYRALAFKIMQSADIKKAELPEATLSIRAAQAKLIGEPDPAALPDHLCKIERKADRTAIRKALETGEAVTGCVLSNGEPSLAIRIKWGRHEPPLLFYWDGTVMVPRHEKLAKHSYVVGQTYSLVVQEPRSPRSHRFFFAQVAELWRTLPEHLADEFPSPDHLRRHALIKAGYCDKRSIACASIAEARRIAAFIRPLDEYALITVRNAVVTVYTAHSQSTRAMKSYEFAASKDAVLDAIARLIGVDAVTAKREAGRAA